MATPREPGDVHFYPITNREVNSSHSVRPRHRDYVCGACGKSTNGRVVCDVQRPDDGTWIHWCLCSCEKEEPTLIATNRGGETVLHLPLAREFHASSSWPPDLRQLHGEGSLAFSAGAYTAAAMVCRKILMVCAHHEKAGENLPFAEYVSYITDNVLSFPRVKGSIDAIRKIGNDATHEVSFVSHDDAKRAMSIVTYMLDTIYKLPNA